MWTQDAVLLFRNCLQSLYTGINVVILVQITIMRQSAACIYLVCRTHRANTNILQSWTERSPFPYLIQVWRPQPEEGKLIKSQTFDPTTKSLLHSSPGVKCQRFVFWVVSPLMEPKVSDKVLHSLLQYAIMLQLCVKSVTIISKF